LTDFLWRTDLSKKRPIEIDGNINDWIGISPLRFSSPYYLFEKIGIQPCEGKRFKFNLVIFDDDKGKGAEKWFALTPFRKC